jgi:hypothetical protein
MDIKSLSDFGKSKKTKDGYRYWCKKCMSAHGIKWAQQNVEKVHEYNQRWYGANPEKVKADWQRKDKEKRSTPWGRLILNTRTAISLSLRGNKNGAHWETLVGYNASQLRKHLEKQFNNGMTWDNYGQWHVDHKIPITAFNFGFPKDIDFHRCWELKNLQPLWAFDNLSKHNRLTKPFQPCLAF